MRTGLVQIFQCRTAAFTNNPEPSPSEKVNLNPTSSIEWIIRITHIDQIFVDAGDGRACLEITQVVRFLKGIERPSEYP